MKIINLKQIPTIENYNHGQNAEYIARYTLTGEKVKADNIPAEKSADCLDYQIKSEKATICKGLNIAEYLTTDKANRYLYVTKDLKKAVEMSKSEWLTFCEFFSYTTVDSAKNGGKIKKRLKSENKKMLAYLGLIK